MYNSRYQGFTPPTRPTVHGTGELGGVRIYWNDDAEYSTDVVTGYSDLEGYKIYKSSDGGETWGGPDDMIYNTDGIFVGWRPYAQCDLSAEEDSLHCVYENSYDCDPELSRGHSVSGKDPYFPWFSLGEDTGFEMIRLEEPFTSGDNTYQYMYEDKNIINGIEYTYSVVAYDMGVEPPFETSYIDLGNGQYETVVDTNYSNPNKWADPKGYASLENSKGTTILDRNFIQVYPGVSPRVDLNNVKVVPNPYMAGSIYNESEHMRRIRFTNLNSSCIISIYTLSGELVSLVEHNDENSGNAFWDLRTVNNQEAGPGLYLYHIKSLIKNEDSSFIGKFAIVR